MRKFFLKSLILLSPLFLFSKEEKQDFSMKMLPGTVTNFQLPGFNKETSFKEWEFFGKKATFVTKDKIQVSDMRLEMFDGKESLVKTATFTSNSADFSPQDNTATSTDTLYVTGEGFDLTGDDWVWDGAKRRVNLSNDVNVEFISIKDAKKEKVQIVSKNASLDYSGSTNKFVFEDSVKVTNDDVKITCQHIETESVKNKGTGVDSLKEIIAKKDVLILQEKISATAQYAMLMPSTSDLNLAGNPIVIDTKSKASVSGDKIEFFKAQSRAIAYSSKDNKVKAKAIIISVEKDKEEITTITADKIEMKNNEDDEIFFDFKGNVVVNSPEFTAYADELLAVSQKDEKGQNGIRKIFGKGHIKLEKDGRLAKGDILEVYTKNNEIWLKKNATLSDKAKGIFLKADRIVILKEDEKALAYAKPNEFIHLEIMQSADFGVDTKSAARKTTVESKSLEMKRRPKDILLSFMKDVQINSEDISARCEYMDVYAIAESIEGRSSINKIEAFENVIVRQKGSEAHAEIAKIFPRLEIEQSKTLKSTHRYMELLTDSTKPELRPQMVLPSVDGIGLADLGKNAKKETTVITSDRQSFMTEGEKDLYIFDGNIIITGTEFAAKCKKIDVEMVLDPNGQRKISMIIMKDNVRIVQGGKSAAAGRADINPDLEMIELTQSPIVVNEDNTSAKGSKITYTKGKASVMVENPVITLPPFKK